MPAVLVQISVRSISRSYVITTVLLTSAFLFPQGIYPTAIIVLVAVQKTIRDMTEPRHDNPELVHSANSPVVVAVSPTAPRLSLIMGLTHRHSVQPSILQISLGDVSEQGPDDNQILESRTLTPANDSIEVHGEEGVFSDEARKEEDGGV